MQRYAERQQERVGFVPVEEPTEIGGEQRVPLAAIEAPIPRLRCGNGAIGHGDPPGWALCIISRTNE